MVRGILGVVAVPAVLVLLASFGGAVHPLGDSLAVGRLWIAAAVGGLGLLLVLTGRAGRVRGAICGALAVAGAAFPVAGTMGSAAAGPAPGHEYTLYQRNLLFLARDPGAILDEITRLEPDFVTLQEVSDANRAAIYDRLPDTYGRAICPFSRVGGVAVATRHPIVAGNVLCIERLGMVAVQVETPRGIVWLVSVHLHWPWPHGQAGQVRQILPLIARMEAPVLIGGDFNMVRWSHVMRQFSRASGSDPVPQGRATYDLAWRGWPGPGLEIDHVLLPGGRRAEIERLEFFGSDHRGLIARFGL